ncbi:MAG: M20/M25/M40 family metallo-hydrolase [Chthoniobacterales bacterium]|nr:M20/M25/M40 family metallo-hydrolase [Chthoniobacterales bacterium]
MTRPILALVLFLTASAAAADVAAIAKNASEWRAQNEGAILSEFSDLLAIPNLASDAENIARNADAISASCTRRGLSVRLLRIAGAPPLVVAELHVPDATRTIGFYAHYDGQPVDRARWKSDPWKPVMRDVEGNEIDWQKAKSVDSEWRIYARSAGDDKAPIIGMLAGLDALHHSGRQPAVNLMFVFEGEEEAGSPHLAGYLAKYPEVLRPDAWVLCDGPVHQSRQMELFFGARGTLDLELTVYGPGKGLHDGHYGNWVPNPIVQLTHLLDSMRDENGRILIKGFYADAKTPTPAELEAISKIPDVEPALRREFAILATESVGKKLNEAIMYPALNLRGIQAGHVGDQASNTIQTEARASIDFRLVPDETPASVKALVERHIEGEHYKIVRETPDAHTRATNAKVVKLEWGSGYPPARTSLDLPLSKEIADLMTEAGHPPVRLPTVGGSIPMYLFQQPDNRPVIGLPIANHDDNQHAENENLRLQNLWDGIEIYATLFAGLSAD